MLVSLVIPVYRNEENLPRLLAELELMNQRLNGEFEAVLVVDGSPDRSAAILRKQLGERPFHSRLVELSRNFGSFAAITAGLAEARGEIIAVMAADLQEPPQFVIDAATAIARDEADIVFGVRQSRDDPRFSTLLSDLFWALYRRFVVKEMPKGGVDVFACTSRVRDHVLALGEANTNLIALLFWLGFRRQFLGYHRQKRLEGKSAWTFSKKLRYLLDSVFQFTDLPIRILLVAGSTGAFLAAAGSAAVLAAYASGNVNVPGYTPTILAVAFFGGLTLFGLGVVGQYLWLTLQNARRRPVFVVDRHTEFTGRLGEHSTKLAAKTQGAHDIQDH